MLFKPFLEKVAGVEWPKHCCLMHGKAIVLMLIKLLVGYMGSD